MPTYGLTTAGLRTKLLAEIRAELEIALRSAFGPETDVDPVSAILGQYIGVFAEREAILWDLTKAVYDAFYPASSEGISLENICDITGIVRLPATFSEVVATCSGTPSTLISAGRIVSVVNTGARFISQADATIGPGGTVDVDFVAEVAGAVQAPAGALTVIETPVTGWTGVSNDTDADVGRPIETDTELRIRRRESLQIVGAATLDAIRARILNDVAGVTDAFVYENDGDVVDGGGRPPHSIQAIVAGGVDQDIGEKIWEVKAAGIQTFGAESVVVEDSQGENHTVYFDRAGTRLVWLHIKLAIDPATFAGGVAQQEKVTVTNSTALDTLTLTVNGRDYAITASGTPATDATALAAAVNNYAANGWIPVSATPTGDYLILESTFPGNSFTTDWASSGDSELEIETQQSSAGDQSAVIDAVIDFAEGTDVLPKEQTIGKDVYRDRYYGPVNTVPGVLTIDIQTADGVDPYWPTTAPDDVTDWAAADVSIDSDEVAQLDTLKVTVEII